jgi:chromosome segregation protein
MRFHGSGIAAIVGPNGCGKSNLSDAISWVLGEQSAKSLRGSRMEDVIFAGTRERKPVGMASVTMTLIDPHVHSEFPGNGNGAGGHHESKNGHPHPEGKTGEITITRRLYRSGESEYLINGRTARLRDIQDIFMGSGLGPESYAIIEQGRIGQILSTKPQDRRAVIEEAAGITRFKTKKRLAEAKLESAKANLARVFDILEEVSRQMNSLKRQAAKAKRYGELKTEMIEQLTVALSGRFRMLERDAAKCVIDLNLAATELAALSAQVNDREKNATELLEASYGIEAQLTEARKELAERRVEAERVRGRLESQAREIASIDQRLARGDAETGELEKRFEGGQLELDEYTHRVAELETKADEAAKALSAKSEDRDRAAGTLRERERAMETSRQQVLRLLGEASTLKNQLVQTEQYLVGIERDIERIGKEEAATSADIARLDQSKTELSDRAAARQMELHSTAEQRKQVDEELSTRKARAAETRRKLEDLRNDASRLRARRDSLEEIILHRSYTTQAVKRLFTAVEKDQVQDFKPVGVLADFLEVDPAYEKAAEEFLHEELEYVVVKGWDQAERGISFMRSDVDGRATFLVHPEPGEAMGADPEPIPSEEGITARLSDLLRMTNGLSAAPAQLICRISRCFLVEDHAAAQRLAVRYPDNYFLLPDGVCYHGHAVSGGKKTGAGPLGLKRELRELKTQFDVKQKELSRTQGLLDELEHEIGVFTEDLERLRSLQQRQEKDAVALDHEMRKLGEELTRANSRVSVARIELQRLDKERAKAQERREGNGRLVAEREELRLAQEQALTEARSALGDLQAAMAQISEEHSVLRVELAGLEERKRSDIAARDRIENQIREMAHRRQRLTEEMGKLGTDRSRLLSDNLELDARATVLAEEIAAGEGKANELAGREAKVRADLAAADEALKAIRHDVQTASEKRSAIELDLVKKQAELKYLDETCRKELNCPLEELAAGHELVLDNEGLGEAEARYQELRSKIDALGPVNTQAVEEFDETQQRYDFLNAQRQDLLDSIRDTERAIGEIDSESRKRFVEAFEAVNANFREMFKTLFSGGMAEMRLTDAENVIESGIDIIASPPGKKLQSVLLLSGGERALTAMALLMAIFRYQPSPFCVLDEVDAPLDEANIERLARLVKEMSATTQFIVITHAKRTMEAAQSLYGVTMQEPGVSKLVSVKFQPLPTPPPIAPVQVELAVN